MLAAALKHDLPSDGTRYLPFEGAAERSVGVLSGTLPYGTVSADDPRHTSVESLAKGLMPNTFDRVVLLHQNPAWSAQDREAIACDAAEHGFELARDGLSIGVPCSRDVGLVSSGYDGSM